MSKTASTNLLLFGATGDLSRRMLLPSLYGLDAEGLLAPDMNIIGTARSHLDDDGFRDLAAQALDAFAPADRLTPAARETFLRRLHFRPLDVSSGASFAPLAEAAGTGDLAIFLSTAPDLFEPTIAGLAAAGLAHEGVRIGLEKPLGHDLASSRLINEAVGRAYPEERTFRIDHYLGKETVQNLIALRFANTLFEPLWNARGIDHVQITIAETVGLENRGEYYDGAGALRDMVQNHMLQLLSLVAMEPPVAYDGGSVRDEKVKVLQALRPITAQTAAAATVIGQYGPGASEGRAVPGYVEELGHASDTETFVALKAQIDNWRWQGAPFYLRTGKRMPVRRSEIFIQFKDVPHSIFGGAAPKANKLLITLQPEESIRMEVMAKTPGLDRDGVKLGEVALDLSLTEAFAGVRRRIAYERLLIDLLEGRPTLFVRRDEVEAQWRWIDGIREAWTVNEMKPRRYGAGAWGPSAAIALIERDDRSWNE